MEHLNTGPVFATQLPCVLKPTQPLRPRRKPQNPWDLPQIHQRKDKRQQLVEVIQSDVLGNQHPAEIPVVLYLIQ